MSRIRIIEDRSKDYRGNHDVQMFCMPHINALFVSQAHMTYNSFRKFARRVAAHFNAAELMILNVDHSKKLIVIYEDRDDVTGEYTYKFWYEPEDLKSYKDRIYYTEDEIRQMRV